MNATLPVSSPISGAAAKPRNGERKTTFFRRIFVDTPEDSLKLRVVTLIASMWAAFSIAFVGIEPLIPAGAIKIRVLAIAHCGKILGQCQNHILLGAICD